MKTAMLVSYDYAPMGSPGAMRVTKFAKYLREFGWQSIVITPSNAYSIANSGQEEDAVLDNVTRVESRELRPPLRALKKNLSISGSKKGKQRFLASFVRQVMFPDRVVGWYPCAVMSALRYAKKHRPDVIFSSYSEATNHFVAYRVSKILNIPWIAEFRDPWSIRHCPKWNQSGIEPFRWRVALERWCERSFFRHAHRVVVVTNTMVEDYASLYPQYREKISLIRNGFDHEYYDTSSAKPRSNTLTYAGSFYGGNRDPVPVLDAIRKLRDDAMLGSAFRFRMVGREEPAVVSLVEESGLRDVVEFTGRLSYADTAKSLMESSAALLIDHGTGNLTTKIFDYIGARLPALCLCPKHSELASFVNELSIGDVIAPSAQPSEIADGLRRCLSHSSYPDIGSQFTRRAGAERLANVFTNANSTK